MKVLVVDDDVMLADLLEATLLGQGHDVCGVATSVGKAVDLARIHRPDIAVLDMQLRGTQRGSDVPDQLAASGDLAGLGILYVTGGTDRLHQTARIGHAYLQKPYTADALASALSIVRSISLGCAVSGALPRGMQLLDLPKAA